MVGQACPKDIWGKEELTREKFVDHPFSVGSKLYRTGDLGKYLPDGRIVFLGRSDDQVKFRGYRIELGEIEHILREHPQVENCAVTVWEEKTETSTLSPISLRETHLIKSHFSHI